MLSSELYDASDSELVSMRNKARALITRYNQTPYTDHSSLRNILEELLGSIGRKVDIQAPFFVDYGKHVFIGNNVFMNFNCIILDTAEVHIGENTMFGPNVQLYTASHPLIAAERIKGPELGYPIHIGKNVWIGGGVIVCPGIKIGDHTTIGAGSVVTKDIPSNVFAAGNPCRVIKEIVVPTQKD